jgi:hypothetical protein
MGQWTRIASAAAKDGWYVLIDQDNRRQIRSGDGWNVPDRGVFTRAAALRTARIQPSNADGEPPADAR